ncbi:hypothetical protein NON20_12070 [Synechocystis sp. B12]|nr:hypothetical protein NON20_12070 [Synechocystis sp. B12]
MAIKAVLFDFDGTIADTHDAFLPSLIAWQTSLATQRWIKQS